MLFPLIQTKSQLSRIIRLSRLVWTVYNDQLYLIDKKVTMNSRK